MRIRFEFLFVCFLFIQFQFTSRALGLLERYPTSLTSGDTARPRDWDFGTNDIFKLSQFKFEVGDQVRIELGLSDVGIGHCADGAVWALVVPRTSGELKSGATNARESVSHVWLRFHPARLDALFPPDSVSAEGKKELIAEIGAIARAKIRASWQGNGRALIPPPNEMTVDIDTATGLRRFFMVDKAKVTAQYVSTFEDKAIRRPPPITRELAEASFDQLWAAFDRDYAMFVLRPEVNWTALRDEFRPKAIASQSTYEFAGIVAEMLKPLRDLHVWLTVAGNSVPVFNRPRTSNANPAALQTMKPPLRQAGREIYWTILPEKVGYVMISGWANQETPLQFDKLLEEMRDTRGLIVDVRLNGGGGEPLARDVAGRFLEKDFVYAFSRYRNGPKHEDLGERQERRVTPRGPWRYNRPVVLLIGQRCMSSNESFIAMMSGSPDVTTMGDHTCGSSGNPKIVSLPLEMTVSVPRWIDYLPDGTPLDERGVEPKVPFIPGSGAFEGDRDDLLTAAIERIRQIPLPKEPIAGPAYVSEEALPRHLRKSAESLRDYSSFVQEEAADTSRPHVVSVSPADGAEAVPGETEIRIRFDRPMDPLALHLDWEAGGFLECEFPEYNSDSYEFTIPVRLPPAALHQVVVNKSFFGTQRIKTHPGEGFLSTNSTRAALFVWRFRTAGSRPPDPAKRARPVKISPPNGSPMAMLGFVEVQFDQEMSSAEKAFPFVVQQPLQRLAMLPGILSKVEYGSNSRTFRIPMVFPPKERQPFVLAGFRDANGAASEPVKLEYQPTGEPVDSARREKAEAAAKDAQLLALLGNIQRKRGELTSIVERVQTFFCWQEDGLFIGLDSTRSEFQWQSPGHYRADVSAVMKSPKTFQVGSDGRNWWWLLQNERTNRLSLCPVADMHELNISLGDPFDLALKRPETAANDLHLRYAGLHSSGGRQCHIIEGWSVEPVGDWKANGRQTQWSIDPSTLRLTETTQFGDGSVIRERFFYDAINQPIPEEAFVPPAKENLTPSPPSALDVDYTRRFVNLRDGSDGTMSVRWGKKGPKGTSSSGLN